MSAIKYVGKHLILDAWQCPASLLNDAKQIRLVLTEAARVGGATIIDLCVHQFSPQGVTATATLAESHMTIHTWPEFGYFAADLFFCGSGFPYKAMEVLQAALQPQQVRIREIQRGFVEEEALQVECNFTATSIAVS